MSYTHEDGRGSLFKNSESTAENKRPHYSGDLMVGGQLYSIGAWVNPAKEGKKAFMALRASPKIQKAPEPASTPEAAPDFNDDIPF